MDDGGWMMGDGGWERMRNEQGIALFIVGARLKPPVAAGEKK
jgi:hypothetical protein